MKQTSLFPIGNGKIVAFEEGPQIREMMGPVYSSPTFARMEITGSYTSSTKRLPHTPIRQHKIYRENRLVGEVVDFCHPTEPVLFRKITAYEPMEIAVRMIKGCSATKMSQQEYIVEAPTGMNIFSAMYPYPSAILLDLEVTNGSLCLGQPEQSPDKEAYLFHQEDPLDMRDYGKWWRYSEYEEDFVVIKMEKGTGVIRLTYGNGWADCCRSNQRLEDPETVQKQYADLWKKKLKKGISVPEDLKDIVENIAVMILCQQSEQGSTFSGYLHRMGYIRDQYGAYRGLLKMGYIQEARKILEFDYHIFRKYGEIHTAQTLGVDGFFHIHENDQVELTGYLILEAFDYLETTGDNSFIGEIYPMLEWAWRMQVQNLSNGMLPFNGDETYIAGGLIPRSAIYHGSCETTMQFIVAGKKLAGWIRENLSLSTEEMEKLIQNAADSFEKNFIQNGKLYANNPGWKHQRDWPDFRHGICERCGRFTDTRKNGSGRYLCYQCFSSPMEKVPPTRYLLPSVSLNGAYIGMDLPIIYRLADQIADEFLKTGKINSSDVSPLSVGYEFGLLLYALAKSKNPKADALEKKILSILDGEGTWGEYYAGTRCVSARCRPWECGINIEAILKSRGLIP